MSLGTVNESLGRDRNWMESTFGILNGTVSLNILQREFVAKPRKFFVHFSTLKMTFKSLMNFGGITKDAHHPSIDRYHSGPASYHHSGSGGYHHGSRGSYKGKGGSNAALSALTLLAFLFLINVMQQSMQDSNTMPTTTMATVVLRENDQRLVTDAKEENEGKKWDDGKHDKHHGTSAKSKIQRLNSQYIQ